MLHLHLHCISLSRNSGHGLLFITFFFWGIPTCSQDCRFHFYVVSAHKYNRYISTFHRIYTEQTWCIRERQGERKWNGKMNGGDPKQQRLHLHCSSHLVLKISIPTFSLYFGSGYGIKQQHPFNLYLDFWTWGWGCSIGLGYEQLQQTEFKGFSHLWKW